MSQKSCCLRLHCVNYQHTCCFCCCCSLVVAYIVAFLEMTIYEFYTPWPFSCRLKLSQHYWSDCHNNFGIKDLGYLWLFYKDKANSWDRCIWVLTLPLLNSYNIALPGPIYLIKKTIPTNSDLSKGSGASKYLGIGPNIGLKERYIPEPHWKFS